MPATVPDPEAGLVQWIQAVNQKDLDRLYDLSPSYEKNGISKKAFIALNRNSSMVADEVSFSGYEIVKKESDGSHATLRVILHGQIPSLTKSSSSYVPMWINFNLTYEEGEWKIWETA